MPELDGTGMKCPKETNRESSVEGSAPKNVPGGESKGGTWIEKEGPNSPEGGGRKKRD